MIFAVLAVLIILWFLGYVQVPWFVTPSFSLVVINGRQITLWDILIFLVLAGLLGILPSPFREIAGVLFILWILSIFGIFSIFAFASLPSIIVVAIIIGLIGYIFTTPRI